MNRLPTTKSDRKGINLHVQQQQLASQFHGRQSFVLSWRLLINLCHRKFSFRFSRRLETWEDIYVSCCWVSKPYFVLLLQSAATMPTGRSDASSNIHTIQILHLQCLIKNKHCACPKYSCLLPCQLEHPMPAQTKTYTVQILHLLCLIKIKITMHVQKT